MEFLNTRSETAALKLMMDNPDEMLDKLSEGLFLSREGKDLFTTIGAKSYYGKVTLRTLQSFYEGDDRMTSYAEVVAGQKVTKDDALNILESLNLSYAKHKAYEHAQSIMQAVNKSDTVEEIESVAGNGTNVRIEGEDETLYENTWEATAEWHTRFMEECRNPEKTGRLQLKSMPNLNDAFGGIDIIDFILICAKSGHGKTTLALNLAKDFAIDQNKVVYYVNAEMTRDQLRERLMSNMTEVEAKEIDRRAITGTEKERIEKNLKIADAVDEFAKKKLILSQVPTIYPSKIKRAVKQLTMNGMRPEIIFIDYIRHMDPEVNTRGMQEYQVMYECAEACKKLAMELQIPIIGLAQLNDIGVLEGSKKMRNAVDGLLFFKEIKRNADDIEDPKEKERAEREIEREIKSMPDYLKTLANYKIIKEKVRRGDPSTPVYFRYKKNIMKVIEVG